MRSKAATRTAGSTPLLRNSHFKEVFTCDTEWGFKMDVFCDRVYTAVSVPSKLLSAFSCLLANNQELFCSGLQSHVILLLCKTTKVARGACVRHVQIKVSPGKLQYSPGGMLDSYCQRFRKRRSQNAAMPLAKTSQTLQAAQSDRLWQVFGILCIQHCDEATDSAVKRQRVSDRVQLTQTQAAQTAYLYMACLVGFLHLACWWEKGRNCQQEGYAFEKVPKVCYL